MANSSVDVDFEGARHKGRIHHAGTGAAGPMTVYHADRQHRQAAERFIARQARAHTEKVNAPVLP